MLHSKIIGKVSLVDLVVKPKQQIDSQVANYAAAQLGAQINTTQKEIGAKKKVWLYTIGRRSPW